MDDKHLFEEWKRGHRQVEVPAGFGDRLMAKVRTAAAPRPALYRPELTGAMLRWGLSAGLTLLGLIRLSLITYNLLMP